VHVDHLHSCELLQHTARRQPERQHVQAPRKSDVQADPGIKFFAELVKKNEAVIIENTDAAMKGFTREEIVIMPFWNGRTFVLQGQGVPVDIEYVPARCWWAMGFWCCTAANSLSRPTGSAT
jgi:hypothetical protein